MTNRPPSFKAISQGPNMTGMLTDILFAKIESGELAPGQQLPTEQSIVASTGVSRTVVREALASLRARGLIVTRQGLGAFVTESSAGRSFSIDPHESGSVNEVLQVLEFRIGVEVEAAGLAAERRTDDDIVKLGACLEAIDTSGAQADAGAKHDFAFHRAMLAASRNVYFTRVFDVLGSLIIPRQQIRLDTMPAAERERYVDSLQREHRTIFEAIRARDREGARRSMRSHLRRAHARYQGLIRTSDRSHRRSD